MSIKCLYPFTNLTVNPSGTVAPCCKYNLNKTDTEIEIDNVRDKNIEELFNQPAMEKIRQQFLNGEKPAACQVCWDEESSGIKSMREFRNKYLAQWNPHRPVYETKFDHPEIITLDFKFSSLCNLKCRICGPYCSSNWLKESLDTGRYHEHTINIFSSYAERKFANNEENFEIFKKLLPNLHIIEFYGGEPLMQPEHFKIMEILKDSEYLSNIYLYYNTNGTLYDDKYINIWNKAGIVELNISLDDIQERFEYQRFPAKWDEVLNNLLKFKKSCKETVTKALCCNISVYNIYYLDEFLKFNFENLNMMIRTNLLHWPDEMCIKHLPNHVKKIIADKLLNIPKEHLTLLASGSSIESIIAFINDSESDIKFTDMLFDTTYKHDQYRNQSFKETFSEYWGILNAPN